MLFLVFDSNTGCPFRLASRFLARSAGLKGMSFATLSEVLGCARWIGAWQ